MKAVDVAIVGGGVIGCSVAWSLASAGLRVVLVERDDIAAHASRAAAGMLAPIIESQGEGPIFEAGIRSLELFPKLVEELRALSGIDPELTLCGILRPARPERAEAMRRGCDATRHLGCEWLDEKSLAERLPDLAPGHAGAMWSPREGHVDPELLTRAYAGAARRRGADIRTGVPALGLLLDGERVAGLRVSGGEIPAGNVVMCGGAWAGAFPDWVGAPLPIEPVKGQMLALRSAPPVLDTVVWGEGVYLVPRRNGTLRVGATVEHAGFDARPTAAGVRTLLDGASALLPRLAEAEFVEAWAGLRPGTPDELPLIGAVARRPGLFVALGHYRNGVMLSAITAASLAEQIVSGRDPADFDAFSPERFAS